LSLFSLLVALTPAAALQLHAPARFSASNACARAPSPVAVACTRRAALGSVLALGFAQAVSAADLKTTIASEEEELAKEEAALRSVDQALKSEKAKELSELTEISKAEDAVLASMKKGDAAQTAKLEAEVRRLKAIAVDEESKVVALQSEMVKEVAVEKKTEAALKAELAAEEAIENTELLKEEEEVLKENVGESTANFVMRFFKQ